MMPETLPQFLKQHAEGTPDKIAIRLRDYGIWQAVTWKQYYEHVKNFALGLISIGLNSEETIAIIGDNRPEWIMAELAAQSVGAKSIGIYQDSVVSEMIYIFNHADVSVVVVEDQEQVDKILEMWDELKGVKKVIYYDPKGLRNYNEDFLIYFPAVEDLGRKYD